jgi:hypothetical protein
VAGKKEHTMKTKHGILEATTRSVLAGLAVLLVAAMFTLAGCDDGGGGGNTDIPLNFDGTWQRSLTTTLEITGANWQVYQNYPTLSTGDVKGVWTSDENTKRITVTVREWYTNEWKDIETVPEPQYSKDRSTTASYELTGNAIIFSYGTTGGIVDDIEGTYTKISD